MPILFSILLILIKKRIETKYGYAKSLCPLRWRRNVGYFAAMEAMTTKEIADTVNACGMAMQKGRQKQKELGDKLIALAHEIENSEEIKPFDAESNMSNPPPAQGKRGPFIPRWTTVKK
jgi:hypothetical protein